MLDRLIPSSPSTIGMAEIDMINAIHSLREAPKVLIADDDPAIVTLLADRCRRLGFAVATAANGVQALVRASQSRPDILIIDINMPEADGLSVCRRLLDPTEKRIEMVVITGIKDPRAVEQCDHLGAYYTRKGPEFWDDLVSALTYILPGIADRVRRREAQPKRSTVREHPRVLLVDDDSDMERFLTSRLGEHGVDVLYAPDPVQGFRTACREMPSVVITDFFMPGGDPYYLLWRLRITPTIGNVPIFVLSGHRLDDGIRHNLEREICGRPGATRILQKSFDDDELFEALQEFCAFETNSAKQGPARPASP